MTDDKQAERARKEAEQEAKKQAKIEERERKKQVSAKDKGDGGGGIVSWLVDTYNGLFRIVILPQLPKPRTALLLVLAFLFGMIWAYGIAPVQFYDGQPAQMSDQQRDQYIILVAGAQQAGLYADEQIVTLLGRVENPGQAVSRLIQEQEGQVQFALQQIQELANQAASGRAAPDRGNIIISLLTFIVAMVAFYLLINVFAALWGLLLGGAISDIWRAIKPKTEEEKRAQDALDAIKERRKLEEQMKGQMAREAAATDFGPSIMQKPSIYTKGRPFDDSFAIEDANDMFLGECGATIAKTIGDGQELAAVEVWLFDKEDFVKTYTRLLVSEHAYNDPVIRSELEPRVDNPATDIVVIQPGATVLIESKDLRVQAKISNMSYGNDPTLPPNSHFNDLTIQIVAWQKSTQVMPMPAAAGMGGLPDPASYSVDPAPFGMTAPAQTPPPPPGGQRDLSDYTIDSSPFGAPPAPQAPPMQPPPSPFDQGGTGAFPPPQAPPPQRPAYPPPAPQSPFAPPPPFGFDDEQDDDNDDPFGGTGDFTPLPR